MGQLRVGLLVAATLFLTACASGPAAQVATPVATVLPSLSSNGDPQPAVDAAMRDAATHLGVSPAALKADQVEPRQWGDSSLGCPKPGLMYSQVVTPGFVIIISGAGKQLEYHADTRGQVVLCQER